MIGGDLHYSFRRAEHVDLPLLAEWQKRPHVAEWWDASTDYAAEDLQDSRSAIWLVQLRERPFAFMQDYDVHGWPNHHLAYLPKGSRGIDQYIADPEMLNRGHGPAFIRQRLTRMFEDAVPVVGTDPHPDNARAIAAYRKAGFRVTSGPLQTDWGLSLLMECRNDQGC